MMMGKLRDFARGIGLETPTQIRRRRGIDTEISKVFDFALKKLGEPGHISHAQLKQDVFALIANGFKRNGFFVEFGATDGIELSNTYLLEREYDWNGILSEPDPSWQVGLKKNRNCSLDDRCVWRKTGEELEFISAGGLSTLTESIGESRLQDENSLDRFSVKTVSLEDLLREHNAPRDIDFLSVDTEGSELDIISSFDFSKYSFNAIAIEHNYSPRREDLHSILEGAGYSRVFEYVSRWDDWYVPAT